MPAPTTSKAMSKRLQNDAGMTDAGGYAAVMSVRTAGIITRPTHITITDTIRDGMATDLVAASAITTIMASTATGITIITDAKKKPDGPEFRPSSLAHRTVYKARR